MEKVSRVLSDFAVEPEKMTRTRGGFLLETADGLRLLQEYRGGSAKLGAVWALQKSLRRQDFFRTDLLICTKKGELSSKDVDGTVYVLKEWFDGAECSHENREELLAGAELLALLHERMKEAEYAAEDADNGTEYNAVPSESLTSVFEKRDRELRRARNFLKSRRRKTDYEAGLLREADYFLESSRRARERLAASRYEALRQEALAQGTMVHGAYHYHNVRMAANVRQSSRPAAVEENAGKGNPRRTENVSGKNSRPLAVAVNFERLAVDLQVRDLYDYIRKALEKNNWDPELGRQLIDQYQEIRPLGKDEMEIFRIMLSFPEKYWKLVNHYYNRGKAWLPAKSQEKLAVLVRQEADKKEFLKSLD